jgi:transcriptional regulator with XRE-family HTH domain
MARLRRPELIAEAARRNLEQLARLGGELRKSRRRRCLTQAQLAALIGVVQSTISQMERGHGGSLSLAVWQRAFLALDRRLVLDASRDPQTEPSDAGHLVIQELVLRLARTAGYRASFELPTRPFDPRRSADVGLRDDGRRVLLIVECWNTFGDIGGAARSTSRKVAEAEELATTTWGERLHHVAGCWVVRDTKRNRELVRRYPEIFAARFPGSSAGWVRALTVRSDPPTQPGLVWCDRSGTRLFAWRRRT